MFHHIKPGTTSYCHECKRLSLGRNTNNSTSHAIHMYIHIKTTKIIN